MKWIRLLSLFSRLPISAAGLYALRASENSDIMFFEKTSVFADEKE